MIRRPTRKRIYALRRMRYRGARKNQHIQNPQLTASASRRWFLPSHNRDNPEHSNLAHQYR